MSIYIKGGRVIDPPHCDRQADILIEAGRIVAIGPADRVRHRFESSKIQHPDARIIDAGGHVVCPGLVDMHVHLREPGFEHKETIASGSEAAVCGGFTAVCCMANTDPVNDSPQTTALILDRARAAGMARVYPVAAVTKNLAGKDLVDFEGLKRTGAIAFSDDGNPVTDTETMRAAMRRTAELGMPVISHCEEPALVDGGAMNAGPTAEALGIKGIPNTSESVMVTRDITLSEQTGAAVHIAHVSTRESVAAIRQAKDRGVPVTAETAPHYFCLTDEAVKRCGANAKMNPPLRSREDLLAIRQALADHTIDAIATDHAPHSPDEKALPFDQAPNGIIGLETALGLSLQLVEDGILTLEQLIAKWTLAPSRILGLPCGLKTGMPADLLVFDPDFTYQVNAARFRSKSRNTPFDGWQLRGKAVLTMVAGRIVYEMKDTGADPIGGKPGRTAA